jgi:hypothetical protein
MNTPARRAAAAGITLVVAAAVIAVAASSAALQRPAAALASPSSAPTRAAASATSPPATIPSREGHAGMFVVPFTYTLPAGVGLTVSVDHLGFYQFRHSVGGQEFNGGIIVRAVGGGRKNPCLETSDERQLSGPESFIDYFKTIPTLTVRNVTQTEVDGRAAITAFLEFGAPTAACPDVWLWAEEGSITQNSGRASPRVTMVDVGKVHVAILVFGDGAFLASADSFIASLHFETSAATPS